jgi:F-type H+-transporting ATPase subunit delta
VSSNREFTVDLQQETRVSNATEDPGVQSIARVYAVAYLDAAGPAGINDAMAELASFVDDVLVQQPDFDRLLRGAGLARDEKLRLIERVVASRATPLFANFLKVLVKHGRVDLVPAIRRLGQLEIEKRSGRQRARVTSAVELSAETLASVQSSLGATQNCELILETRIDPSLLGGLVIRVGDTVYDGSMKTQIKQLRARLRERCLNEIQRGRDRFSHPEGN